MFEEILSKINFISPIFYQVLYMTVIGSIVGLLIYFIRNIFDKKISGKWKCIMWCIALITLLIPIRIEIKTNKPVIIQNEIIDNFENIKYINQETFREMESVDSVKKEDLSNSDFAISSKKSFENMEVLSNADNDIDSISNIDNDLNTSANENNIELRYLVLNIVIPSIWIIGILVFVVTFISGSRKINKRISKHIYKDERIENILAMCKNQLGIKKKINIVLQNYKKVPSIFGILNPVILITEKTLEEDNQTIKYIFLHELSHYKRKDLIFNYILLFVLSIHWFNPIVWFLLKKIRQDIEIGADELASKKLDKNEKKEYGMVLINLLRNRTGDNYTASMLCMSDTGKNMERRIHMIKGKSKSAILSFILVIIVFIVVASFIFIKVIKVEDIVNVGNQNNLDSEIAEKEVEDFGYEIPEKVTEVGDLTLNITSGDDFSEGIAGVTINNEYGYYIDKKGNIVLNPKNKQITGIYAEGLTVDSIEVSKNKYKYGYVDKTGDVVIDYIYDEAYSFGEGLAPVKKDGKYGFIDNKGNWVLDFKYDGTPHYFYEGLLWVSKDGKYGCIDKQGNVVIDFKYDGGFVFSEGLACVEKDGKFGYIDKNENVIIDYEYDEIQYAFSEGLALVYKDGKYKYIDKKGSVVLDPPYQYMGSFSNGLAWVRDGNKYGFIDKQGNLVIDIQYDAIGSSFSEGLACVEKNGKCGYINYDGKVIIGNLEDNTVSNELSKQNNNEISNSDKQKITEYIDVLCNDGFSRKIPEFKNINDADKYWIYGHLSPKNAEYSDGDIWLQPFSTKEEMENQLKELFGPELTLNLEKDINENEDLLDHSGNIHYNEEHNVYEFYSYGIYISNYYAINSIKKNDNEFIVNVVEYMQTDNAVIGKYMDTGKYYYLVYSTLNGDDVDESTEEIFRKESIDSDTNEDIRKWADSEVLKRKDKFRSFNITIKRADNGKLYITESKLVK